MYLEWMGKNRAFVEKFIRYANTYAAVSGHLVSLGHPF